MRSMPEVGAVVHTHSRYAAAFAVARLDLPFICNESIATRAERVLVTEYAPPGSADLGEQALRALRRQPGSRAVLLANHGVVAIAPELEDAYVVAQSVEWTAEICHLARTLLAAGAGEHVLDRAVQDAIARNYDVVIAGPSDATVMDADRGRGAARARAAAGRGRVLPPGLAVAADAARADGTAIVAMVTDAPDGFSQFHRLDRRRAVALLRRGPDRARPVGGGRRPVATSCSAPTSPPARCPCTWSRPARGWRPGRRAGGACSATRWPLASRRPATRVASSRSSGPVGRPRQPAIDAMTRPDAPRRMPDGL